MNEPILFSDEQSMLLETAADFCRNRSPIDAVRRSLDAEHADLELWREMAELGWLGINVPEEHGGLALGLSSVVPVVESMGRYLMGTPFIASTIATELIVTAGSESQQSLWLPKLMDGAIGSVAVTEEDGSWLLDEIAAEGLISGDQLQLSGKKYFVTDADVADIIIVSAMVSGQPRLVLVQQSEIPTGNLQREVVIDQTRRSFQLDLTGIEVSAEQMLPGSDFRHLELSMMLLLCAEISGGLTGALHTIVEYLNTRKAFDRYIGSYQSLKHPAADIVLSVEAAKSHLYHAATVLKTGDAETAETAIRLAKAQGGQAFAFAGDRAVQFHGGFGFTFECDAQLYLRRALWCQYQFGDEHYQRQLLAPLLLDDPAVVNVNAN